MKKWNENDYFTCKSGSKIWPSNDANDSPFGEFTCKLCGYTFSEQTCGSSFIGMPSFQDIVRKRMIEHLERFHMKEIMGE